MGSDGHADLPSSAVAAILEQAGWYEGRDVPSQLLAPDGLTLFPVAEAVLREFGGLRFGECGAGVDFATSDVVIDPRLAVHLKAELDEYGRPLGTRLFPLGEVHRGHGYLVIDEQGRTYLLSDKLSPLAVSFSQALESLLLGVRVASGGTEGT
jgi:hypothetical protein